MVTEHNFQAEALGQMLFEEVQRHAEARTRIVVLNSRLREATERLETVEKELAGVRKGGEAEATVIVLHPDQDEFGKSA